jgi:alpha-L-arabinofuranosidase
MLKAKSFDTYTLKLKGKKLDGYNAFIIPFAVKDSNTFLRAHIGAWVNKITVFEKVSKGYDVSNISASKPLAKPIEAGRWYDIELQVGLDSVKCYLDGELLLTYTEPQKLFAIAGKDQKNGDVIVKLVNAYGNAVPATIKLDETFFNSSKATLTTLSAPGLQLENSYQDPARYTPVSEKMAWPADGTILVKPYSINVLRLSATKNK